LSTPEGITEDFNTISGKRYLIFIGKESDYVFPMLLKPLNDKELFLGLLSG
jgi:hypothetical protein